MLPELSGTDLFSARALIESLPVALLVTDVGTRILQANAAVVEVLGIPVGMLLGQPLNLLVGAPTYHDGTPYAFDAYPSVLALRTRKPVRQAELLVHRPDGTLRYLLLDTVPMLDETGTVTCLVYSCADITAFRQNTEETRLSEARFAAPIELASEAIVVYDVVRDRFVDVNRRAEEVFGRSREQLLRAGLQEVWSAKQPDGRPVHDTMTEYITRALAAEEVFFEPLVHHPIRGERRCAVRIVQLPAQGHHLLQASVADITDRMRADERLRTLSRAVEQSPVSVVITDPNGSIEYVNPKFCEVTGYSTQEVLGQNPRVLQSGLTLPETFTALWSTLVRGSTWQGVFANRKKNGEVYWEHASIAPIVGATGAIIHYVAVKEDVTERRRVEDELERAKDVLERSERRHRALFEQAGVAMAELALDGRWQLVNTRFCALFGYSREELLHHNFLEITHEDDRARDLERVHTTDDTFTSTVFEKRFIGKDGAIVWVSATVAAVRDEHGHRTHDVGIFEDISARKHAESAVAASEKRYQTLIDHAPDAILVYDVDQDRWVDANQKAEQLFACSRAELLAGGPMRFYPAEQPDGRPARETLQEHNLQALAGAEVLAERTIHTAAGDIRACEVRVVHLPSDGRRLVRASYVDVTARRQLEAAHRRLESQFREILRMAPVGTLIVDQDGTIEFVNEALATLHQYTVDELIGQSSAVLLPAQLRAEALAHFHEQASAAISPTSDVDTVTKSGALRVMHVSSVRFEGLDGRPRRASFVVDRTEQKRAEQQLVHAAAHDPLTGLPNRAYFTDRLQQELGRATRERGTLAVLQIDLNRFKQVNDTLGHAAGDVVLSTTANRLREALRVQDTVARLGGDEFAVLLPGADEQGAMLVADKLRTGIRASISVENTIVSVDGSFGLAMYPQHAEEATELLRGADLAMYVAKAKGGGVALYSAQVEEQGTQNRALLHDLLVAAERGQLRLFFQPVIESGGGSVVRAEALVRWQHPTLGLLRPKRFLPAADLANVIDQVTLWVLDEALRQCRGWQEHGHAVGVEVGAPIHTLEDAAFPNQVRMLLERHGIAPRDLTITVGENALMLAVERILPVLARLADLGVRVGLDEFGVGQSSLSALSRLPLNQIKVDRSFVAQAMSTQGSSLIAMILGITTTLGLTAVLEGVEPRETWNWLRGISQLELQGYSGGHPLPADEFVRWLRAQ